MGYSDLIAFNRFLLILIALSVILFWAGIIFAVWVKPNVVAAVLLAWSDSLLLSQPKGLHVFLTGLGGSAIAISLLILIGELFPKEETTLRVGNVPGGQATIATETVTGAIKTALEDHEGIRAARATAQQRGDAIEVQVDLHAELDSALAPKADEVVQVVRQLVEGRWGLRVKNVRVTFVPNRFAGGSNRPDQNGDIMVPGLAQRPAAEERTPPGS